MNWGPWTCELESVLVNSFEVGQESSQNLTCLVLINFGTFCLACKWWEHCSPSICLDHGTHPLPPIWCLVWAVQLSVMNLLSNLQHVPLVFKLTHATLGNTASCHWSTSYLGRFCSGAVHLKLSEKELSPLLVCEQKQDVSVSKLVVGDGWY